MKTARLLMFEEVYNLHHRDKVWVEINFESKNCKRLWRGTLRGDPYLRGDWSGPDQLVVFMRLDGEFKGRRFDTLYPVWRLWTSKPSKRLMRSTPWKGIER